MRLTLMTNREGMLKSENPARGRVFLNRWWREKDSNLRRQSRQIYSLIPLAAREPLHGALLILHHNLCRDGT